MLHSLEDAIVHIAQAGYKGIEILADAPHGDNLIVNSKRLAQVARLLKEYDLTVSNINANTAVFLNGLPLGAPSFEPSLSNPDKAVRRRRLDFTFAVFDMAQAIGADTVSITSGLFNSDLSRESQMGYFLESINEIVHEARDRTIRVGIEAEPGLLIGTTEEAGVFVEQVGSPYLGLNWDAGHAVVAGERLEQVVSRYGNHFFNIHIEDIAGKKHYHLIPGEGDICFKTLFNALHTSGYSGFYTVELYTYSHAPVEAARKSFSFLSELVYSNG